MRRAVAIVALVLLTAACSEDQDPGIAPGGPDGTNTTSQGLQPCPPGGQPDATTAPAGCLDEDGVVQPGG